MHNRAEVPAGGRKRKRPAEADLLVLVVRAGVEPATFHFSGGRSYQLSYLTEQAGVYGANAACPNGVNRLRLRGAARP